MLKFNEKFSTKQITANGYNRAFVNFTRLKTLWFNNKNTKWVQAFEKPKDFSDWKKLPEIIEELYE